MKSHILLHTAPLWALALIIPVLVFAAGCSGKPAIPKIDLNVTSFDLGDISPEAGKRVETFTIRNTGGAVLSITTVSTSCGCTKADVEPRKIPPGGQAQLTVTYDPSVHPDLVGAFKRVVYIQSNDPIQAEIELELLGNALPQKSEPHS